MTIRSSALSAASIAVLLSANAAYAATTVSQPTTILYGGGATLPANAYVGASWLNASPALRESNTLPPPAGAKLNAFAADKASLFNQYALTTKSTGVGGNFLQGTVGVSYCQTGSGAGRRIFVGNTSKGELNAKGACGDYAGTPTGFSAANATADFAASDAPLSQGEVTSFGTNAGASPTGNALTGRVQPVQVPAVAGAVAVVYNNADLGKTQLNLTQSDVCGIFSGSITNWSQLTHTPKMATIPSKTITLVYRSDGSGTTFSFTNYLSKVCGSLAATGDTAVTGFQTTDTFGGTATSGGSQKAFTGFTTASSGVTSPAGFTGANGNGNVVQTVSATDGAIGYAEIADALARAKVSGGSNLKYASIAFAADQAKRSYTCNTTTVPACAKLTTVSVPAIVYNKLDPVKNFLIGKDVAFTVAAKGDEVLNGLDPANPGRPLVSALDASGLPAGNVPGCLLLVEPNAYAAPVAGGVAKYNAKALKDGSFLSIVDYGRYPITAISYLFAYNGGNGGAGSTKLTAVQGLMGAPFNGPILKATKTIGSKTGYAPLSLNLTGAAGADISSQIAACVAN